MRCPGAREFHRVVAAGPCTCTRRVTRGKHDMALIFGNEMAGAEAAKAALQGAAEEQVAWVGGLAWQAQG